MARLQKYFTAETQAGTYNDVSTQRHRKDVSTQRHRKDVVPILHVYELVWVLFSAQRYTQPSIYQCEILVTPSVSSVWWSVRC